VRISFDIAEALGPRPLSIAAHALLVLASVGCGVWLLVSAHDARLAWRALHRAQAPVHATARTLPGPAQQAPQPSGDFVQELPTVAPTDAQIRFVAKLARESQVELLRMQSEPVHVDPQHLGQVRVTLQLRGDYRDEKALLGALLAKFPGLTLERLAIRHRGEAAGAKPGDTRSDDEVTLELTQYTRPVGT
jgi:hypothetical protein